VIDTNTANGKVVVNRSMSVDGLIAGPGDVRQLAYPCGCAQSSVPAG
jgi:hypothetical protein